MSERTIPEILAEIENANERLEALRREEAAKRSAACDALNVVNRLQKELDAKLTALKSGAPRESDWHRAAHIGIRIPAD